VRRQVTAPERWADGNETEIFFLDGTSGPLLAVYRRPPTGVLPRGRVLYVHPFAEELNLSRRLVSVQSRALAKIGYGVLTVDLSGCGDSGGAFRDGRWDRWLDDVATAYGWLEQEGDTGNSLWGLRLGALLAMDFAAQSRALLDRLVLWQPVLSGKSFIDRFLMLRIVRSGVANGEAPAETVRQLRDRIRSGKLIDVCGYEIHPELVKAIDELQMEALGPLVACRIHWIEVVGSDGIPFPIASERIVRAWTAQGLRVSAGVAVDKNSLIAGEPVDGKGLLELTGRIFLERDDAGS
jgi:exosortase A-associated hydrolase 2